MSWLFWEYEYGVQEWRKWNGLGLSNIRFRIAKMDTTAGKKKQRPCSDIEAIPEMNAFRVGRGEEEGTWSHMGMDIRGLYVRKG